MVGKELRRVVFLGTWLFFIISMAPLIWGDVLINEVMYDPNQCSDSKCEWIELYNFGEEINLTGCLLDGKELGGIISKEDYFLVVRNLEEFEENFYAEGEISGGEINLKNSGEEIVLGGKEGCEDNFDYSNFVDLADGNGKSLERREEGSWGESLEEGGTPGEENSVSKLSTDFKGLEISEIMADPLGEDGGEKPKGEWIELYNGGEHAVEIKGLLLKDSGDDNELYIVESSVLTGVVLGVGDYVVIYRDGDTDFSLNNNGYDEVRLFYEGLLLEEVSYSGSTEGMSWAKVNGEWYKTVPTPGEENIYEGKCNWELELVIEKSIFLGEELEFELIVRRDYGEGSEVTVKGYLEDINGKILKEYSPWTNKKVETFETKKYSPNLMEGVYQLTFQISEVGCEDEVKEDDSVSKLIAINPDYKNSDSSLAIEELYLGVDNEAEWGDQFKVKLTVYKGEETKHAVELWAEKNGQAVSKRSKMNVYDKFKEYPFTFPIQLIPNCNNKFKDGEYNLILEGLGLRVERGFVISGVDEEICRDYLDYVEEMNWGDELVEVTNEEIDGVLGEDLGGNLEVKELQQEASLSSSSDEERLKSKKEMIVDDITGVVVYESSSAKAGNLMVYLLLITISLLCVVLIIWEKGNFKGKT
ncbi:lamin tail domain-containing protein [Candidatus Woesearchaeota archaeon]|jgi:hypothetical protein|nr:lamin tail domain-containing protein [Candidatus Woesearchaeota archaeon]